MDDSEAIQRKLTELDLKIDLLTKRMFAYVTTILQILHNPACAGASAGRQGVVGFREMLHYLNQNEKDFAASPPEADPPSAERLDKEFIRIMKPLWDDPDWGNGPLDD